MPAGARAYAGTAAARSDGVSGDREQKNMEGSHNNPDERKVSAGSLRVAHRFLAEFFGDSDLPRASDLLCNESCKRFRALEQYHESIRNCAENETRPILIHAVELWRRALRHAGAPADFISFIHQTAEDLGVTRQDCIRRRIWLNDLNKRG